MNTNELQKKETEATICCYALFCQINDKPLSKRLDKTKGEK